MNNDDISIFYEHLLIMNFKKEDNEIYRIYN